METQTKELEVATETPDLEDMERADTIALWTYYNNRFSELTKSAELVLAGDPALPANSKLARVARLDLKNLRVEVENKRKELGEYHLRKTQAINSEAKKLKEFIEPYEEKLLAIEQHAERVEAERKRVLSQERTEKIVAVEGNIAGINFGEMSDDQFSDMLKGATLVFEAKKEEARKAEEARIAKEKAEAEERERIAKENERLKKEAAEKEAALEAERKKVEEAARIAAQKAKKEREELEAKQAAELAEVARLAKIEQDKKDKEAAKWRAEQEEKIAAQQAKAAQEAKEAVEKARVEQARIAEDARKEREAREKLEREVAEKARLEQEKLVQQENERKRAAAAPDKEKVMSFAATVRTLAMPALSTPKGKEVQAEITGKVEAFAKWIESKTAELGK